MTAQPTASLGDALERSVSGRASLEPLRPAALIGLEHEYRVLRDGAAIDFRDLIHQLDVPGRRLDPGDANAYRLFSGLALTCDDAEAEIATPPLLTDAGFTDSIAGWALAGQESLRSLLPSGVSLEGFSTHISVSFEGPYPLSVIDRFCRTFAPSLALIFETTSAFGIYLRPRPGRIELCGDYVLDGYLQAAAAFLTGGIRACAAAVEGELEEGLAPALEVSTRPAFGRYGRYLGRGSAFGFDLYAGGRRAELPLAHGGTTTAQQQLSRSWQAARAQLTADGHETGIELMDAIVAGDLPLRVESDLPLAFREIPAAQVHHPLGDVVRQWRRPGFGVEAVCATWDFTIVELVSTTADVPGRFVSIPRDSTPHFLEQLAAGELDARLSGQLQSFPKGRRLRTRGDALSTGLWDELESTTALLPPEYDPSTGGLTAPEDMPVSLKGAARAKPRLLKPLIAPFDTPNATPAPPIPFRPAEPGPEAKPPPLEPISGPPRLPPRPLIALAAVVVAAVVVVAAMTSGVLGDESPATAPAVSNTSTSVPTSTKTPEPQTTPTPTIPASPTAPAVNPPLPTQTVSPTILPQPPTIEPAVASPVATIPGAAATAVPSATVPTATPPATATATRTRTPTPTVSPTSVLDPTRTPTSTCGVLGAICTPTATPVP